jgi:hypothetical protein
MKIVVIGGTGLIGSKTVAVLRQGGHEVVAASPKSGINSITGEGLKEAMAGAQAAIDLANSPSFEDKAALEFFESPGRNLLAAEAAAGVRHRAVHRRNRPDRQWLFPRQGRSRGTDQDLRHPLHHHPLDPIPGIRRRHRCFKRRRRHSQAFARPVPADRGGRRCCHSCRCGARGAAKRLRRDRRPGTRPVQRNHRPLSEGGRRPTRGRERPRGPILARPGRGALARAVGRGAPRPYRLRRMAPPLTGRSRIPHPTEG